MFEYLCTVDTIKGTTLHRITFKERLCCWLLMTFFAERYAERWELVKLRAQVVWLETEANRAKKQRAKAYAYAKSFRTGADLV
jgi:hypothetical protein